MQSFEQWFEKDRVHKNVMDKKNREIYVELEAALQIAELKHPIFATNIEEGVLKVVEELGELSQCINKKHGEKRVKEEALDALVTMWRLVRRDYNETM